MDMSTLYVVATPIGNLEDLTFRAARILGEVDRVLAEDTRRTGRLLAYLEIRVPLVSLHAHNEAERVDAVLGWLGAGEEVALVSDAGTPLVSDPGARVVRAAIGAGHAVVPVPGPSAVLGALVGSGIASECFTFLGFPPRRGGERERLIARVASAAESVVLFESPERTGALLEDLSAACGGARPACVARELTKVHETFRRGTLAELAAYYREAAPRGEVSVVVAPAPPPDPGDAEADAVRLARRLLAEGRSPSRAAKEVARTTGVRRNRAYELIQSLHDEEVG
jgi:16S rRNA (cytidine1402-2'-O)-methyltransferase